MIDKKTFEAKTKEVYERVMKAFDDIDPDIAEADFHLDNITITFANKTRFIINRQPPVNQLWLATKSRGHHFNYDEKNQQWICDHTGKEFYSILNEGIELMTGEKIEI